MIDFDQKIKSTINDSIDTKRKLLEAHSENIIEIGTALGNAIKNGNKIMFCGNGGSAADAQHLAAELVVRLRPNVNRRAIPGLALTVDPSIITAGGNDYGYDSVFERGVEAYSQKGDVLVGISTSGNSENVHRALKKAKELGVTAIGLLGKDGGRIKDDCDHSLVIPSDVTARIQESHIMVGHIWCEMIEEINFPEMFK